MENFNPNIYRNNLAKEIKHESDKTKKREMLNEAKLSDEYQLAKQIVREQSSSKIEKREDESQYLKVERGRLMHSGEFYGNFAGKTVRGRSALNSKYLNFGVNETDEPADNCSLYFYSHGKWRNETAATHRNRENVAVYKKDYVPQVLSAKDGEDNETAFKKELEYIYNCQAKDEYINSDFEYGLETSSDQMYDLSAIEHFICFSKESSERMKELIMTREDMAHISVYIEKISPEILPYVKEKYIGLITERADSLIENHKKNLEQKEEKLRNFISSAENAKVNVEDAIARTYDCIKKNELISELTNCKNSSGYDNRPENWQKMNESWLVNQLGRFGYVEYVDKISRDFKEHKQALEQIISAGGIIPVGSSLNEALAELEELQKTLSEQIKKYIQSVEQIKLKALNQLTESNNHNIDDLIESLNSDNIFGQKANNDKGLVTPQQMLWPIDKYARNNRFKDIKRLFVYEKA